MTTYTPGRTYHGFNLIEQQDIAELDSTIYYFRHALLGCRAFAIKNNDPNKTFCAAFMTIPEDSTGVAHILEHSVLMGSKKYPAHDVFGEINKGGLMTFLNAMTGQDTTWYPFATRNEKEYFNIMDVYCDVTLHPLLEKTTFEQEGWHYHIEELDDDIAYSGVVLNEMRGAFSDPIRALFHQTHKALLPGSTYAHESGGDPACIPDLSFEQFVTFHQDHYHPSNATFLFYGNASLDKELSFIQDNFLSHFPSPVTPAQINPGSPITSPVFVDEHYPVQPGTDNKQKTFLAVSSIIGSAGERKKNTAFEIIAHILFNSDASPLKKAIVDAGLCKDFGGLFLGSATSTIMMTYLMGSEPDLKEQFLTLYQQTLAKMTVEGLDRELVISELNKFEFKAREDMNKAQRGLDIIGKIIPAIKFDQDPFQAVTIEQLFADIREDALENNFFEQLIQECLLENQATAVVCLMPDEEKLQKNTSSEQKKLTLVAESLSGQQRQELVQRTSELTARQTTPNPPEVLELLPRLSVNDLDPVPAIHRASQEQVNGTQFIVNELGTNGIYYLDFGLDCSSLPAHLLPFLDLFCTIVTETGTTTRDYIEFTKEINKLTGGFSHSFNSYQQSGSRDTVQPVQWFHVKTLSHNLEKTIELLSDVFANVNLTNRQRIKEIVQREYAWLEHSVQSEGYMLASTQVFSHLSLAGKYNEYISGAHSYLQLKELAQQYDALEEQFLATLQSIKELLFKRQGLILSITANGKNIRRFRNLANEIIEAFPDSPMVPTIPEFIPFPSSVAFSTSAEVIYNVQGCTLFSDPGSYNGSFEVLKTWISRDYLWNTVRQQGGAYGCFIQFNPLSGNFGIVSYRDPQVDKTYEAYDALQQKVAALKIDDAVLSQLVIGTYGNFTPHQGPASMGATARNDLLSGITKEFKQQRIEEIIGTTGEDLNGFASFFDRFKKESFRATIGNRDKIAEAENLFQKVQVL